jgi:hypothetical protein
LNEFQAVNFYQTGIAELNLMHLSADLYANDGSLQCNQGAVVIHILTTLTQSLLGSFLCPGGAFNINLICSLRCFGQDSHLTGQNFCESPSHGEPAPSRSFPKSELSNL